MRRHAYSLLPILVLSVIALAASIVGKAPPESTETPPRSAYWDERFIVPADYPLNEQFQLQPGDEILAINGKPVVGNRIWHLTYDACLAGGELTLQYRRGSRYLSKTENWDRRVYPAPTPFFVDERFTLNAPFGLKPGDELLSVNGVPVFSAREVFDRAYEVSRDEETVTLRFRRGQKELTESRKLDAGKFVRILSTGLRLVRPQPGEPWPSGSPYGSNRREYRPDFPHGTRPTRTPTKTEPRDQPPSGWFGRCLTVMLRACRPAQHPKVSRSL